MSAEKPRESHDLLWNPSRAIWPASW